ncbi:MAG: hypothetical protein ACYC4D_07935 [Thermoleophilia bacterium]
MTIELVLIIFFTMVLGPVVITLVYCGFRGCGGSGNALGSEHGDEPGMQRHDKPGDEPGIF